MKAKIIFNISTDLDGPKNYNSDNGGSNLHLCQRTDRFITFHDVYDQGFGFLHKLDDFVAALKMAILTNRTLIDYAPSLARRHNLDLNGTKRQTNNPTPFLWKFSNFFDLNDLHFAYRTKNVSPLPYFVLDKHQLKNRRGKGTAKCMQLFFSVVSHLSYHGIHERLLGGSH